MAAVAPEVAAAAQLLTGSAPGAANPAPASVERFEQSLERARETTSTALIDPLMSLNRHSSSLAEQAASLEAQDLRPSELMMLTMRSHEFLFHCELVSNVANRSSDGVQQLFRQQS